MIPAPNFNPPPVQDVNPPPVRVDLGLVFDLSWVDLSIREAPVEAVKVADFEKVRRFPHCGAAIAWARRQLYHGKVFGDAIEMRTIRRVSYDGVVKEHEEEVQDVTMPGFRTWKSAQNYGGTRSLQLSQPVRKLRVNRKGNES